MSTEIGHGERIAPELSEFGRFELLDRLAGPATGEVAKAIGGFCHEVILSLRFKIVIPLYQRPDILISNISK